MIWYATKEQPSATFSLDASCQAAHTVHSVYLYGVIEQGCSVKMAKFFLSVLRKNSKKERVQYPAILPVRVANKNTGFASNK